MEIWDLPDWEQEKAESGHQLQMSTIELGKSFLNCVHIKNGDF